MMLYVEYRFYKLCLKQENKRHQNHIAIFDGDLLMEKTTSGWVKQAAGTELWFSTWGRSHMFSTALIPWALAACASMYFPTQWHSTSLLLAPTWLVSACWLQAKIIWRSLLLLYQLRSLDGSRIKSGMQHDSSWRIFWQACICAWWRWTEYLSTTFN